MSTYVQRREASIKAAATLRAHKEAKKRGISHTVSSCTLLAELGGYNMHIVPGSEKNIKITTAEDMDLLRALFRIEKEASE